MTEETVEFDADAITSRYLYVRNARAKRSSAAKKEDDIFKAELDRLEGIMRDWLDKVKLKSAPCINGTFFKQLEVLPVAEDWTEFYEWISKNKAYQFLHKRITAKEVAAYMEEHKDDAVSLPPGIRVEKKWKVVVRTATDKGDE